MDDDEIKKMFNNIFSYTESRINEIEGKLVELEEESQAKGI